MFQAPHASPPPATARGLADTATHPHDGFRVMPPAAGEDALPWGAQTELARQNFAIGDERVPVELLRALLVLKAAAAQVNGALGRVEAGMAAAIAEAANDLLATDDALLMQAFPLSPWQSGSLTQSHVNVNEVLARAAQRALGRPVHANDDVNHGQSSNDVVPSAMHVAVVLAIGSRLMPALAGLCATLAERAAEFDALVKLGRTHLQDAVPLTLGQEIGAWRSQLQLAERSVDSAVPALLDLALGGTAVGTGLNTHPQFAARVCERLVLRTNAAFAPASDRFAAMAGHEPLVALHGALKVLAVALSKMANDIRLLASGPQGGFGELVLPANEPGSSIMPGKVNPTQCEALAMVCWQVMGNDMAVTLGAAAGHLQLNTAKPLIAVNVLRSLRLLADAMQSFDTRCARGLAADPGRIAAAVAGSLMLVTALAPHIGYDRAAQIAQHAHAHHLSLRAAALAAGIAAADFDRWTDPASMLGPA